jgi:hypothetical protein
VSSWLKFRLYLIRICVRCCLCLYREIRITAGGDVWKFANHSGIVNCKRYSAISVLANKFRTPTSKFVARELWELTLTYCCIARDNRVISSCWFFFFQADVTGGLVNREKFIRSKLSSWSYEFSQRGNFRKPPLTHVKNVLREYIDQAIIKKDWTLCWITGRQYDSFKEPCDHQKVRNDVWEHLSRLTVAIAASDPGTFSLLTMR